MGFYLNSNDSFSQYRDETAKPYFIDKTGMLEELIPLVEQGGNNLCITRPRRFGKSTVATMIGSYFGRGIDAHEVFDSLQIAEKPGYHEHLNQHNVIYIDFSKYDEECDNYRDYIGNIKELLKEDLREAYPEVRFREKGSVGEDLKRIHQITGERFIFVFDEWDCIFHKDFFTKRDRKSYVSFLANLTKGMGYVLFTYMTGVLPIAKYSQSDTLNNFMEYTMASQPMYNEYFGFTEGEVDDLYRRYCRICAQPSVTREDLSIWYDGYHTAAGTRMYNPRSVVYALTNNHLASYWTGSGQYAEIAEYITGKTAKIEGLRDDVILMAAGESVPASVEEYAATAMNLSTKEEVFSAMVVYGFLNYENGYVRIPNKELMDEFSKTLRREKDYRYILELERESKRLLEATIAGKTDVVEEVLEFVHNSESPLKAYNDEAELSGCIKLAYIAARDRYNIQREDQAGIGYVDYIFYPYDRKDPGIIIELKVNATPEYAIGQIKEKKYALKFKGKIGEKPKTEGQILAVGIAYKKKSKVYKCKIEVLS
ncbi:MAG: ATP-binding protein [Lachnospiraceae bacterium]|nr:ATP-binding protein [Lachnospiraceae bacterium]